MIKKTVTCEDFDGNSFTEDYYFHLTKSDLMDWAAEDGGGLVDKISAISQTDNPLEIIPMIKEILIRSFGVKSTDGKVFMKDPELVKNFQYSAAFSELYIELSTDSEKASEFIDGIMPKFDIETQKAIDEAKKKFQEEQAVKTGE